MTSILVPMDGNPPSEAAFEYALAEFPAAHLTVVYVVGTVDAVEQVGRLSEKRREQHERAEAEARQLFEGAHQRADDAGVDLDTEIVYGAPARAIPEYAGERGVDRIVMGEHGEAGARQILLGSVTETVVRRAPVPVTVVRGERQHTPNRRILVPIDGSREATYALDYALEEHAPDVVSILHVIDVTDPSGVADTQQATDGPLSGRVPSPGSEAWYEQAERAAERLLDDASARVVDADVSVETEIEVGDPSRVIVELAAEGEFDHVIVGNRGRTGLDRLLLGSVAEAVVKRSPVTVTVVRDPER